MKIYIAGKITGDPNYVAKFALEEDILSDQGHIVLNPANMPEGLMPAEYMRMCLAMIDVADVIYFLSDWADSAGARIEQSYAAYIGKKMFFVKEERGG
ncbi:MAG: DUF4406 domain-containing protein [Clostridia bacterium]|nr:DUF4406 domain-containing protein [Clostridia bacterium]